MRRMHGLEPQPQIDSATKVLILGSFPGEESLRARRYYANKRNEFWKIVFRILSAPLPQDYEDRIAFLQKHGIALWDVVESCHRQGSLDSEIREPRLNDIDERMLRYPNVGAIFLNGTRAGALFMRRFSALCHRVHVEVLPSTSPANARISFDAKIDRWRSILMYLSE